MANLSTYLLVLALMLALVTASDHRLKVRMKKTGLYDQYSAAPDSKEAVDRSGELDRMFDGSTQTRDVHSYNPGFPDATTQQARVKDEFLHAWSSYEKYAFGHDEIKPISHEVIDHWGGFGATLVDSLDTMMVMGLNEEVARARVHVQNLNFDVDVSVSFFETGIRYLGGLLAAYELSRDSLYLSKATQLGEGLLRGFSASQTGLPMSVVNLKTGASKNHQWCGGASILSEIGSLQLEFAYLSHHTNDLRRVSVGSMADSFYEYLLKLYLLTDHRDVDSLRMFNEAVRGIKKHLIGTAQSAYRGDDSFQYVGDLMGGRFVTEQEHLSCFIPGLLALASQTEAITGNSVPEAELRAQASGNLELAAQLTRTCVEGYLQSPTGLGPETMRFNQRKGQGKDAHSPPPEDPHSQHRDYTAGVWKAGLKKYMLRPETLESVFLMWRTTHDQKYRDWGWRIFEAIIEQCKTPTSYSGIKDVGVKNNANGRNYDDAMQSFLMAETFKYLYLLFSDDDVIPLDKYVFNTEAHILGVIPGGGLDY